MGTMLWEAKPGEQKMIEASKREATVDVEFVENAIQKKRSDDKIKLSD